MENSIKHDWLRDLWMMTYGFILYGASSYAWYELFYRDFLNQSFKNLLVKVWFFFSIIYTFLVVGNVNQVVCPASIGQLMMLFINKFKILPRVSLK